MTNAPEKIPTIQGVLATALYVEDLDRSAQFFRRVFGFEMLEREENYLALRLDHQRILLLKKRGTHECPIHVAGGVIPPAEGEGSLHLAFAVAAHELEDWIEKFKALEIPIESRINWKKGGAKSVYLRDPDDNCIEIMTPGVWDFRN